MKQNEEFSLESLLGEQDNNDLFMMSFKQGLKNRELTIDNDINEDLIHQIILPLKRMEQENFAAPIKLYINSPGGNIMDGLVLCNLIDNIQCPLIIEILGYAYSMACYIAMAGTNNPNVTRVCHPYSFGLIHAGSVGYSGDARKAKQLQAFYDKIDIMIKDYILSHTKITEEQYNNNLDIEWYMTADEMLELGLVDKII